MFSSIDMAATPIHEYTRTVHDTCMDIYIKPYKKVALAQKNAILVKHVAQVVAPFPVAEKVRGLKLRTIPHDGSHKKNYLVPAIDMVKAITAAFPHATVSNVGEIDTLVNYAAHKSRDNPWWKWLKVAMVVVVLLAGSGTAIMSFQTDSQVPKVFTAYYKLFTGEETEDPPRIITIPYALGLAAGIMVFYNHALGKKLTDDPTPIEVEMEQYDTKVTDAMVDMLHVRDDPD